jgi:hypothetical protein
MIRIEAPQPATNYRTGNRDWQPRLATATGNRLLVTGYRLPATGNRQLATGYWQRATATGYVTVASR